MRIQNQRDNNKRKRTGRQPGALCIRFE
jgi:hypothetical protein